MPKIIHVFTIFSTTSFFDGQFRYLADRGYDQIVVCTDAEHKDFCERNHVRFIPLNVERRISLSGDIKTISDLVKIIRSEKPDAVVGHTPKGAMVAMIASFLARVKTRVYFRHGLIYTTATGIKRRIFKTVEQFTALLATNIVNVSPSLSKLAVRDHLNSNRKQLVLGQGTCGGIDAVGRFNPDLVDEKNILKIKNSLGIRENELVVGFCGRLCRDKGINELVAGFKLFRSRHSKIPAKLLLIGPYDTRDILSDSAKEEIANSPDIITTGRIPQSDLPAYYSAMDMFVFPSYREGFGMCVVEASAMELPILVSRSHGCIDSIREHQTGEYINLSPEGIAAGIEQLTDNNLRLNLGKEGRRFVLRNFDHSIMWPLITDYYSSLNL